MLKVSFHTLGCKLNFAETSLVGRQFINRGFQIVEPTEPADVCVVNTCSVTARADRECRQLIRRALRTSKNPFLIVTGCYAQLEPEEIASFEGVDLVLGAREKFDLFDYVGDLEKKLYPHVFVSDINTVDNFGPAYSNTTDERTRAYLKIQDGCDYHCSFCTIPLARGGSRSQPIDVCLEQARLLASEGYREITLTGVNVGDYGRHAGTSLFSLLCELTAIEGVERFRISSIEPNLITDEILEFVASNEKMCKHFHIPLQSGSHEILHKMRRRYTPDQYWSLMGRILARIPDCGIGADVIVGFPGETEELFEETYLFLTDLPISYLHAFTYSERPDTPASKFGKAVEPKIRFKRNKMLRVLGQKKKQAFHTHMIGKIENVLLERDVEGETRFGFTGNYVRVGVDAQSTQENMIVPVEIMGVDRGRCLGRITAHEIAA